MPGEFHGQRSLVAYSPRDRKETDMTKRLTHTHTHTHKVRKGFSEKLTSNLETKLGVGSRKIQTRRKDELKQKKENYV